MIPAWKQNEIDREKAYQDAEAEVLRYWLDIAKARFSSYRIGGWKTHIRLARYLRHLARNQQPQ